MCQGQNKGTGMTTVLSSNLLMQAIRALMPLGSLRDGEVVAAFDSDFNG
jgi:hypothetical protein